MLWVIDMSSRRPSRWSGRRHPGAGRVIPLQRDAPSNELRANYSIDTAMDVTCLVLAVTL